MQRKILLVDDSEDLLEVYVSLLRAVTPYEVRTASSGRVAMEIIRTWRPDLVVTDVIMPEMNGLELIAQVRSELPPPLPTIVAWSGFPEFEEEARRRGAHLFQPKPIDPEDLVILVESLLSAREPPPHLREGAEARRRAASVLAQAQVAATLARRPYFQDVAALNARLISRYFDGAEVAVLVMDEGEMRVFAASDPRWGVGSRVEGILGYAGDVLESGSTLIVPDVAAMPAVVARANISETHLLAAVPLRSEHVTIGALVLVDRRAVPFDAQDLSILAHLGAAFADIFAGRESAMTHAREPGVLAAESWLYALRCEVEHLRDDRSLVIVLSSSPPGSGPTIPVVSAEHMNLVTRAVESLLERLPPRTALGRLASGALAAYSLAGDASEGERAVRALMASLADDPSRDCMAVLTVTGLRPTDGGVALRDIAQWLLASAVARGPGTTLHARLTPEILDTPRAA